MTPCWCILAGSTLFLLSCRPGAPPLQKVRSFEQGIVIERLSAESIGFDRQRLRSVLRDFILQTCHESALAQWIVMNRREDERFLVQSRAFEDLGLRSLVLGTPMLKSGEYPRPIAGALCYGGNGSIYLRSEKNVIVENVIGNADAREIEFEGGHAQIIYLRFHSPGPSALTTRVPLQIFVAARVLPALGWANRLRQHLERLLVTPVLLVVRNDPYFLADHGPVSDPFQFRVPPLTPDEFLSSRELVCALNRECEVRSTGALW